MWPIDNDAQTARRGRQSSDPLLQSAPGRRPGWSAAAVTARSQDRSCGEQPRLGDRAFADVVLPDELPGAELVRDVLGFLGALNASQGQARPVLVHQKPG